MLSRNDPPNIDNFNFGVDSVFTNSIEYPSKALPLLNVFLLLEHTGFLLLGGGELLLLS